MLALSDFERNLLTMNDIVNIITSVGFPIAMCLWFMWRTEKVIKDNTKAIHDLCKRISEMEVYSS